MIKVGVVTINVIGIGIKFEKFMQAGCRDSGLSTMYCQKPIILPKLVLFFWTFLELPILPSIICCFTYMKALKAVDLLYLLIWNWPYILLGWSSGDWFNTFYMYSSHLTSGVHIFSQKKTTGVWNCPYLLDMGISFNEKQLIWAQPEMVFKIEKARLNNSRVLLTFSCHLSLVLPTYFPRKKGSFILGKYEFKAFQKFFVWDFSILQILFSSLVKTPIWILILPGESKIYTCL